MKMPKPIPAKGAARRALPAARTRTRRFPLKRGASRYTGSNRKATMEAMDQASALPRNQATNEEDASRR